MQQESAFLLRPEEAKADLAQHLSLRQVHRCLDLYIAAFGWGFLLLAAHVEPAAAPYARYTALGVFLSGVHLYVRRDARIRRVYELGRAGCAVSLSGVVYILMTVGNELAPAAYAQARELWMAGQQRLQGLSKP